jgi:deoxyribonuclease V
VDFDAALAGLLRQVPRDRHTTYGELARALGDVAASVAVAERLRLGPSLPGGDRVAGTGSARRPASAGPFTRFRGFDILSRYRRRQLAAARGLQLGNVGRVATVAGADVAYSREEAFAAIVTVDIRTLAPVETAVSVTRVQFPYIPGYLAARELPPIRAAWRKLASRPDLLLIDGHGVAHPSGFGVACAAGVSLRVPAIGVAKSRLVGVARALRRRGDAAPLYVDGARRGWAIATADPDKPVYVSPGQGAGMRDCLEIIPRLSLGRIPEPLRMADKEAGRLKSRI